MGKKRGDRREKKKQEERGKERREKEEKREEMIEKRSKGGREDRGGRRGQKRISLHTWLCRPCWDFKCLSLVLATSTSTMDLEELDVSVHNGWILVISDYSWQKQILCQSAEGYLNSSSHTSPTVCSTGHFSISRWTIRHAYLTGKKMLESTKVSDGKHAGTRTRQCWKHDKLGPIWLPNDEDWGLFDNLQNVPKE